MRIGSIGSVLHGIREEVFASRTRETIYHGEIAFLDATGIDLEELLRTERHVLFRIGSRFVVLASIDTEDGEVASVARPHPVVGIATELTDGARRGTYQANVGIYLIYEQEVLVAVIKRTDIGTKVRIAVHSLFLNLLGVLGNEFGTFFFGHLRLVTFHHFFGYILHVFQERNGQARIRQFFRTRHRPETISQIVVLYRAMRLDLSETAMVVGDEKAFARNEFTGTATAETYHRILQGRLVHTIDIFGRKLETLALNILDFLQNF